MDFSANKRLKNCVQILLELNTDNPDDIFEYPDNLKLRSSMTLFEIATEETENLFGKVIDKYFDCKRDELTINILKSSKDIVLVKHIY